MFNAEKYLRERHFFSSLFRNISYELMYVQITVKSDIINVKKADVL